MRNLFSIAFLLLVIFAQAQLPEPEKSFKQATKTRILFLLDGSGSMYATWEGQKRIDVAKELLSDLVDSLKTVPKVEVALRVYGHQYAKKFQNCQDTKLEVPFQANNHELLKKRLQAINPMGVTPLAYSMQKAAGDFPREKGVRNIIVMITDGLESCDGDPCAVSMKFQRKGIFLKPFIIGIGGGESFNTEMDCVGKFIKANDVNEFNAALHNIIRTSFAKTSVKVDLLDQNGKASETNVNMSFVNNFTGQVEYDYVHYRANGKSDYLEVEPVLTYNLVVNTIPKVVKKDLKIKVGQENTIKVKTPQGFLKTKFGGFDEYKGVTMLIRLPGSKEILHTSKVGKTERLLVGKYEIELLTLPRVKRKIEVKQSQTTTVDIASPGVLNIKQDLSGFGSIYELSKSGKARWIFNIKENSSQGAIVMQPGKYKVVFRSQNATGSEYTYTTNFSIKSGGTTSIKLIK